MSMRKPSALAAVVLAVTATQVLPAAGDPAAPLPIPNVAGSVVPGAYEGVGELSNSLRSDWEALGFDAARAASVACEVVPGITAAAGCAAARAVSG